jgi:hypothetical protein
MHVKQGDMAEVIQSIDGASVGLIVNVVAYQGEHSLYGPIWRCRSNSNIVTEFGGVGHEADFADDWLRKIEPPEKTDTTNNKMELVV